MKHKDTFPVSDEDRAKYNTQQVVKELADKRPSVDKMGAVEAVVKALGALIERVADTLRFTSPEYLTLYLLQGVDEIGRGTMYKNLDEVAFFEGKFTMSVCFKPLCKASDTEYFQGSRSRAEYVLYASSLLKDLARIRNLYSDGKIQIDAEYLGLNKDLNLDNFQITINVKK
jgi:hypothetical protein